MHRNSFCRFNKSNAQYHKNYKQKIKNIMNFKKSITKTLLANDSTARTNNELVEINPTAKVIVAILYVIFVASYPKYKILELSFLLIYPVVMIIWNQIAIIPLVQKILLLSPFVIFIAIFNPILDTKPVAIIFGIVITHGMISALVILQKFIFTISCVLILVYTTPFNKICSALVALKVPRIFVVQLNLLYRYIFVLSDEWEKSKTAWALRSFSIKSLPLQMYANIFTALLIRSIKRAQQIYLSMLARGFESEKSFHNYCLNKFFISDYLYVLIWSITFILSRVLFF